MAIDASAGPVHILPLPRQARRVVRIARRHPAYRPGGLHGSHLHLRAEHKRHPRNRHRGKQPQKKHRPVVHAPSFLIPPRRQRAQPPFSTSAKFSRKAIMPSVNNSGSSVLIRSAIIVPFITAANELAGLWNSTPCQTPATSRAIRSEERR